MPMAKQDFDRFMNQVRVRLPGASDAGIKGELFEVFSEFFEDSNSWTETLTVPVLASNPPTLNVLYSLLPQYGGRIIRLIGAWDANSIPQAAFLPQQDQDGGPATMQLVNYVTTNQNFTVAVIKNTCLPTSHDMIPVAPEWLLPRFGRYILDGILGKMMSQPGKSYTDDKKSQYHLQRFRVGIAMAKTQAERQFTMGAQSWRYPRQYRSHGQRGGIWVANPTTF